MDVPQARLLLRTPVWTCSPTPNGVLAPLPSHVAPTGLGWATVATLTAALVVAVAEVTRRLGKRSSGSTGSEHPDA